MNAFQRLDDCVNGFKIVAERVYNTRIMMTAQRII